MSCAVLLTLFILAMTGVAPLAQEQTSATPIERLATATNSLIPLAVQRLAAARSRLAAFRAEGAPTRAPEGGPGTAQDLATAEALLGEVDAALLALDTRIAEMSRQRSASTGRMTANADQARSLEGARREVLERRLVWLRSQAQTAAETTSLQQAALRIEASETALRAAIGRAAPPTPACASARAERRAAPLRRPPSVAQQRRVGFAMFPTAERQR